MSVSELHRLLRKLIGRHANRAMGELNGVLWLLDGGSAQFALLIDALRLGLLLRIGWRYCVHA